MNLKEAFRYQNKLQSFLDEAQSILDRDANITKVENTYLRRKVMAEAEDETVPLLERVKFLSIFTSNLDEFYMIRVGSLGDVAALGGHGVDNKSGLTAKEQLERIYAATAPLYERRDRVFRRVERELGAEGLQRLRMSELTQDELSAYLNDSAVQKSHSNRFDSSYLLCKEKDGSTIVVWYESEADIAEKTELCTLLGIKNVYVLK